MIPPSLPTPFLRPVPLPSSSLESVIAGFLRATSGAKLPGQQRALFATDDVNAETAIPDARLPFLSVLDLDIAITPQAYRWRDKLAVTARCLLKLKAPKAGAGTGAMRQALDGLLDILDEVRGLYVDVSGKVYNWKSDPRLPWLIDREAVRPLADIAGPTLRSARTEEIPGTPYCKAHLQVGFEFYRDSQERPATTARVAVVGLRTVDPDRKTVDPDTTVNSVLDMSDYAAIGLYDSAAPSLSPADPGEPPFPEHANEVGHVLGIEAEFALRDIQVSPASFTLAASATKQLTAVAVFLDSGTANWTALVTWASTNALIATVSAAGLVTGVATGVATIGATKDGITSAITVTVP